MLQLDDQTDSQKKTRMPSLPDPCIHCHLPVEYRSTFLGHAGVTTDPIMTVRPPEGLRQAPGPLHDGEHGLQCGKPTQEITRIRRDCGSNIILDLSSSGDRTWPGVTTQNNATSAHVEISTRSQAGGNPSSRTSAMNQPR